MSNTSFCRPSEFNILCGELQGHYQLQERLPAAILLLVESTFK